MTHDTIPPGRAASRQHLQRLLLEQFERTFTTEGHEPALHSVNDLLTRLDDDALRSYAYSRGIRSEDEFEGEPGASGDGA
jgi:hypothetical protein